MNSILKKVLITAAVFAIVAYVVSFFMKKKSTQLSPLTKVEFLDNSLDVKIIYCQPFKKGRLIFGTTEDNALQPFGHYWRLGANDATTIETNKDLIIKGNKLPKGVYSMYAFPNRETWKIGINEVANRWGASEPDYSKDLFIAEFPVENTAQIKEQFTIMINKNEIVFWWETSKIIVPYEIAE